MSNILLVTSSPRGAASLSTKVATELAQKLSATLPGSRMVARDLVADPLPHIAQDYAASIYVPANQRTPDQIKALDESDAAVAELFAADHIILATGLINFSISSTLKSWVDHIARVGRTFRYSETGPEGLVSGKRVTIVLASGGVYSEGPNAVYDFAVPYLKGVLGFLGVRDFDVIRIEGTGMGEEAVKAALEKASAQAAAVVNAARLAKAA